MDSQTLDSWPNGRKENLGSLWVPETFEKPSHRKWLFENSWIANGAQNSEFNPAHLGNFFPDCVESYKSCEMSRKIVNFLEYGYLFGSFGGKQLCLLSWFVLCTRNAFSAGIE